MTYTLSIERKPTHLHVVVTGENTRSNVLSYMEDVMRECEVTDCWYVLLEERLKARALARWTCSILLRNAAGHSAAAASRASPMSTSTRRTTA